MVGRFFGSKKINFRTAVHEFINDTPLKDRADVSKVMRRMLKVNLFQISG